MRSVGLTFVLALLVFPLAGCEIVATYIGIKIDEVVEFNRDYDDIPGVALVETPDYSDLILGHGLEWWYTFMTATHTDLQRRAISFKDGNVRVSTPLGEVVEQFNENLVRGMAWSNAGTRLALVERTSSSDYQHTLHIRDEQLGVVATHTFVSPSLNVLESFVVSWSADDEWIAVSTTSFASQSIPGMVVINAVDGRRSSHRVTDAYFVGERSLIFTIPPENSVGGLTQGSVWVAEISDAGDLSIGKSVSNIDFAAGSHPATATYVAVEYVPYSDLLYGGFGTELGLRSLDGDVERPFFWRSRHGSGGGDGAYLINAD